MKLEPLIQTDHVITTHDQYIVNMLQVQADIVFLNVFLMQYWIACS